MIPAECINELFNYLKYEKEKQTGCVITLPHKFVDGQIIESIKWKENFEKLKEFDK